MLSDGLQPCLEIRVLDGALEILGPNGEHWAQGQFFDADDNHCMLGAILSAKERFQIKGDRTVYLVAEIIAGSEFDQADGDMPEQISETIQEFNDHPGRPFEHISEVLRKARAMAVSR